MTTLGFPVRSAGWAIGFLLVLFCLALLTSCGAVQSSSVESMSREGRTTLFSEKSDLELCNAYNHPWIKPETENDIAMVLRDRNVSGCIARGKYRRVSASGSYLVGLNALEDHSGGIEGGNFKLTCTTPDCERRWSGSREVANILHDEGYWKELANYVATNGIPDNLSYYYLGRAAEGLGSKEAAIKYYGLTLHSQNCGGTTNKCDGVVFPQDPEARSRALTAEIDGFQEWREVAQKGTLDAYKEFIDAYPRSSRVPVAKMEIEWIRTLQLDTADSYTDFLNRFPRSKYQGKALSSLWEFTRRENTVQSYAKFASDWPQQSEDALVAMRDLLDPQIKQAARDLNCQNAQNLAEEMNRLRNGYYVFNYESCLKYRELMLTLREKDPRKLYFSGVKYEEAKDFGAAKTIYTFLIDNFSSSEFALRASDRIFAINDLAAKEARDQREREAAEARKGAEMLESIRRNRREQDSQKETENERRKAQALQRATCQSARTTCINSCPKLANGRRDFSCENRCGSCP